MSGDYLTMSIMWAIVGLAGGHILGLEIRQLWER